MYDCIIVGAGPAGASAAYHLAKKGASVLLLEQASLPRYKPCGGGVSPVIQEWFDFDFSPAISLKSPRVYCTWGDEEKVEVDLEDTPIWMVRRDVFDHFLVKQAIAQGATLKDQTPVTSIEFKNDSWLVNTANEVFSGRYLIGADGSKGSMAKWLGFTKQKKSVVGALELEIPSTSPVNDDTYFEFGLVKNGYAWNFPKADGYSIGAGSFAKKRQAQSFHNLIEGYTNSFNLDLETGSEHGYPIALWDGNQKLHTQNAVLAGEAACVVDPFTAEGIRPSIFSGIKASEAIVSALAGETNALAKYSEIMTQEWGTQMAWASKLGGLFYRFPKLGYQVGVKNPAGGKTMMQVFTGKLTYEEVANKGIRLLTKKATSFIH